GGHGNYSNLVLAPASAQEMFDFTRKAFTLADQYRLTVFILSDAYIGQMMEPVEISGPVLHGDRKDWAVYGDAESRPNLISSIYMNPHLQRKHNELLQDVYQQLEREQVDYQDILTEDADLVFIAYGISARICLSTMHALREKGVKVGLMRPKTLFPFPKERIQTLAAQGKILAVVELSSGMMADDVELQVRGRTTVLRYLTMGGETPTVKELIANVERDLKTCSGGGSDA
ncbi:MAG: 3-methyl-2-oxobutanoate dehydrogenase subunit VorB, partial [Spirochaetae bacterium HGW-Spirochaetae-8]